MCCFSRHVESVSNTNIFARSSKESRQFLVYSMTMQSKEDLAMILPIPVPSGSPDDAVKFIDLKGYPDFFKDMFAGFPPPPAPKSVGRSKSVAVPERACRVKGASRIFFSWTVSRWTYAPCRSGLASFLV